jgi:hypothetical protein
MNWKDDGNAAQAVLETGALDDLKGLVPESWCCVDCGVNTAPGLLNRTEMEKAIAALGEKWSAGEGINQTINCDSEVYTVRETIWKKAGMEPMGGCLCIGCLERRLGRAQAEGFSSRRCVQLAAHPRHPATIEAAKISPSDFLTQAVVKGEK